MKRDDVAHWRKVYPAFKAGLKFLSLQKDAGYFLTKANKDSLTGHPGGLFIFSDKISENNLVLYDIISQKTLDLSDFSIMMH